MGERCEMPSGAERRAFSLRYHSHPERGASCGSIADDLDLLLTGAAGFAKDGRLQLTEVGFAELAALTPKGPTSE
jgi:hypothetical protein